MFVSICGAVVVLKSFILKRDILGASNKLARCSMTRIC